MTDSDDAHKPKVIFQPTLEQLIGICKWYDFKCSKNETYNGLLNLLEEKHVEMNVLPYDGPRTELEGAVIHWIENPQTFVDSGSLSGYDDHFDCPVSDETNDVPNGLSDTKVDASLAIYECCPPFDFDVQHEEVVEAVEY